MTECDNTTKNKKSRVCSFEENSSNANAGYILDTRRREKRDRESERRMEARAFMIRQLQSPKLYDETRLTFMTTLCRGAICASVVY